MSKAIERNKDTRPLHALFGYSHANKENKKETWEPKKVSVYQSIKINMEPPLLLLSFSLPKVIQ